MAEVKFSREFAMPDEATFSIPPIARLLDRYLGLYEIIIDPFARNSTRGSMTNDLNPRTSAHWHLPAQEFLIKNCPIAMGHAVLFDPPYSPRQIVECYRIAKKKASQIDTQNARLCKEVKDLLDKRLVVGGIAIACGWNSNGMGIGRGYELLEVLLVNHGAAHNDTIVTVERKIAASDRQGASR